MLHLSNSPNVPLNDEEDLTGEADEPPDELARLPSLPSQYQERTSYIKSPKLPSDRRESLLTRALLTSPEISPVDQTHSRQLPIESRGMSTASTRSNASAASTADLTSDGGITSPARTNTPSPPPPPSHYTTLPPTAAKTLVPAKVVIAHDMKDLPAIPSEAALGDSHESVVEANLGRKRCISFACGRKVAEKEQAKAIPVKTEEEVKPVDTPKRKCMLTFACPSRTSKISDTKTGNTSSQKSQPSHARRHGSPAPSSNRKASPDAQVASVSHAKHVDSSRKTPESLGETNHPNMQDLERSEATRFHEFASSQEDDDEWVNESTAYKQKITLSDCMKKENAIRQLGEEAEEEAKQDEEEEDELAEPGDDNDDDSALSDDGNESDNEEGFAESDDESDIGSNYQFWAPSTTTAATSTEHLEHIRPNTQRRTSDSSIESLVLHGQARKPPVESPVSKKGAAKARKIRPSTPDLPDSTDFVCGTLDEDRPLEAAYISCREERKRAKHVLIPQDIDPSFPTTDPEDNDDNDDDVGAEETDDHTWIKGQLDGFDDETQRGRHKSTAARKSPAHSPKCMRSPPPKHFNPHRSPPPRRLFGQSPKRLRSPPPLNLKSPPGTRRSSLAISPTRQQVGINITRLAQRPNLTHTKSLPRTPNPFFSRYEARSEATSVATSPKADGAPIREMHTRGPIDIVTGLEKKRQKRKEKFWQKHCRKAAKEQQERKPQPGKGAERMKELGLEVAERTKGYGLGQKADFVLSI